ncbi:hypothetical protein P8452_33429 [Trifolium repens]|nr:hypothetical protein P8452_33429 [Trifolium repens]
MPADLNRSGASENQREQEPNTTNNTIKKMYQFKSRDESNNNQDNSPARRRPREVKKRSPERKNRKHKISSETEQTEKEPEWNQNYTHLT